MMAQIEFDVLNTLQGLEYIKELWPSFIRITYIFSTLHHDECIQNKQSLAPLPQTPSNQPTYFSHPQILSWKEMASTFITVDSPTPSFNHLLPVLIPCYPFRHWVKSDWSATLSCPSQAQSHSTSSSLFHIGSSQSTLIFLFHTSPQFFFPISVVILPN